MQAIDLMLRGGAIGVLSFIALRLIIVNEPAGKRGSLTLVAVCVSCYLLVASPSMPETGPLVYAILCTGSALLPFALTLAALELLFDDTEGHRPWLVAAALCSAIGLLGGLHAGFHTAHLVTEAALFAGILVLAIRTIPDDLVETRRTFRRGFVAAFGTVGTIISVVEFGMDEAQVPAVIFPLLAFVFLSLAVIFGLWCFAPENGLCAPNQTPARPVPRKHTSPVITKLLDAMDAGAWRTEGLTIGTLAEQLGTVEHKLRPAINQELGFRNFSTFINSYRIGAAMIALDDPEQADRTILEIAYETGFASLGPFNRAFRHHAGVSPREYRTRAV